MDKMQFQTMFKAIDQSDMERIEPFLHPELTVHMLGVEGQEAPLDKQGLLEYFKKVMKDRKSQGGTVQHVPSWIVIQENLASVHGTVRSTFPDVPEYRSLIGICYAGVGIKDKAISEGKEAFDLIPIRGTISI